ncbi:hypothetical protein [Rhodanobacter soli]|uniref:ABC-type multidrug transport system permease subunit n=1 Tax=Rhodanobacter soli TaxID=590609 RepID=A0ABV2PVY8_9GAMM
MTFAKDCANSMSARNSNTAIRYACSAAMLLASAMVVGLQFLYTGGQICHAAMMVYKVGGFVPHLISFGRFGVLLYLVVAVAVAMGLSVFIRRRGGARHAKVATCLLVLSLASTLSFVVLIVMPSSDVVFRS